jgi:very-short-patch-repair endonuclease
MINLICETCGKNFSVYPSRIKFGNPRYCSDTCFYKRPEGHKTSPRIKVYCLTCGKPMLILESKYADGTRGRYCSQKCMIISRKKHPSKEKVECVCLNCGKHFNRHQCVIKNGRGRYCSRKCVISSVNSKMRTISPTSIELALMNELNARCIEYTPSFPLPPWSIDIAFPVHKLAVEADGTYWHGLANVKEKDKRKDKDLAQRGWIILHFTEDEINTSPSICVDKIIAHLNIPKTNTAPPH